MKNLNCITFLLCLFCINLNQQAQTVTSDTTIVLTEDFHAFTEGSLATPGTVDISSFSSGKLAANLTGWSGRKVYEAGGALLITGGTSNYLQTAKCNLSANNKIFRVTFRVKSTASYGNAINCQVGYNAAETFIIEDDEWHTISMISEKGSSSIAIKFSSLLESFYIDDVRIDYSASFIKAPTANQPKDYDRSSFTASWSASSTATNYILTVYEKGGNGENIIFSTEELASSIRSKKISGLNPKKHYSYRVQSKNITATSDFSNEIDLIEIISSLDAPIANEATNINTNSFTANWQAVDKADSYTVTLHKVETLSEDKLIVKLLETFEKITEGSTALPEIPSTLYENLDKYTTIPGWSAYCHAYAGGYLAFSPFSTYDAYLLSPEIDLSANGGAFEIKANLFSNVDGNTIDCIIINGEDNSVIGTQTINLTKQDTRYTLQCSGGVKNTIIKFVFSGSNKAFINNLSIEQQGKVGDIITSFASSNNTSSLSYNFSDLEFTNHMHYAYSIIASAITLDSANEIITIKSLPSNMIEVKNGSSIQSIKELSEPIIYRIGNDICINLKEPMQIEIYNIQGQKITSVTGFEGTNIINCPSTLLIVKVGNKIMKVK